MNAHASSPSPLPFRPRERPFSPRRPFRPPGPAFVVDGAPLLTARPPTYHGRTKWRATPAYQTNLWRPTPWARCSGLTAAQDTCSFLSLDGRGRHHSRRHYLSLDYAPHDWLSRARFEAAVTFKCPELPRLRRRLPGARRPVQRRRLCRRPMIGLGSRFDLAISRSHRAMTRHRRFGRGAGGRWNATARQKPSRRRQARGAAMSKRSVALAEPPRPYRPATGAARRRKGSFAIPSRLNPSERRR